MLRPAIAARVSSTNPVSLSVSECSATGTPWRPATVRQASIAAGTAVRFEPGITRTVTLVPLAGARVVPGLTAEGGLG